MLLKCLLQVQAILAACFEAVRGCFEAVEAAQSRRDHAASRIFSFSCFFNRHLVKQSTPDKILLTFNSFKKQFLHFNVNVDFVTFEKKAMLSFINKFIKKAVS